MYEKIHNIGGAIIFQYNSSNLDIVMDVFAPATK